MIKTIVFTAIFLSALANISTVARAESNKDQLTSGHYLLAATPAELAERERVIELAVNEFFFLARPFARSKLTTKTRVAAWANLQRNGGEFVVEFEGRSPVTGSVDAPSQWCSPEDEVFSVEFRLDESTLIQTLRGDSGTRSNRFRPGAEGVLVLDVDIMSPKLSAPLRYALTYRMQGLP